MIYILLHPRWPAPTPDSCQAIISGPRRISNQTERCAKTLFASSLRNIVCCVESERARYRCPSPLAFIRRPFRSFRASDSIVFRYLSGQSVGSTDRWTGGRVAHDDVRIAALTHSFRSAIACPKSIVGRPRKGASKERILGCRVDGGDSAAGAERGALIGIVVNTQCVSPPTAAAEADQCDGRTDGPTVNEGGQTLSLSLSLSLRS